MDTADNPSVDVGEVFEILEFAVNPNVEVTAIITKEKGKTFPDAKVKGEVDVVEPHLLT